MVVTFAVLGYVLSRLALVSAAGWIAIWLAAAVVLHDLVLFPLYSAANRYLLPHRRRKGPGSKVPWINHVRVPVIVCGTLLLVSFPLVLELAPGTYEHATGLSPSVYLGRYVAIGASVFVASGLVYAVRVIVFRRRGADTGPGATPSARSRHSGERTVRSEGPGCQ